VQQRPGPAPHAQSFRAAGAAPRPANFRDYALARGLLWTAVMRPRIEPLHALLIAAAGMLGCMPTDVDYTANADVSGDCPTLADTRISSATAARNLPQSCFKVAGTLEIRSPDLLDLEAFQYLREVNNLVVQDNAQLRSMAGLDHVRVIQRVQIDNNALLEDVVGLEGTETLEQLTITKNPLLRSISGLRQLKQVGASGAEFRENGGPVDLQELESLNRVEGSLQIRDNTGMQTLKTGRPLDAVGDLIITGNRSVEKVGFETTAINGSLTIGHNEALSIFDGFRNLTTLSGDMTIEQNAALIDFEGFSASFTAIGRNLKVDNNPVLDDVYDLAINLISIGGSVTVTNNILLSACRAEDFTVVDEDGGFLEQVGGLIDIGDNSAVWDPCD
jgi:hypothetical protein